MYIYIPLSRLLSQVRAILLSDSRGVLYRCTHTPTHVYIFICQYIYIYIYMHMCIYLYIDI